MPNHVFPEIQSDYQVRFGSILNFSLFPLLKFDPLRFEARYFFISFLLSFFVFLFSLSFPLHFIPGKIPTHSIDQSVTVLLSTIPILLLNLVLESFWYCIKTDRFQSWWSGFGKNRNIDRIVEKSDSSLVPEFTSKAEEVHEQDKGWKFERESMYQQRWRSKYERNKIRINIFSQQRMDRSRIRNGLKQ